MRLAFERVGSGEPLVLLHGIGHRRQAWYPVLDQLAEHREVILLDFPGHGESDPLATEGRPLADVLRAAFRQFLADQRLVRPHVAGNSLGGRVALEAAALGDARSATGLSPAGFWRTERSLAYTRTMFKTLSRLSRTVEPQAERLSRTAAGRALAYGWFTAHPGRISSSRRWPTSGRSGTPSRRCTRSWRRPRRSPSRFPPASRSPSPGAPATWCSRAPSCGRPGRCCPVPSWWCCPAAGTSR